ncbi:unnamed protein product [Meloidogyne enterolobii]|uniref:Uncharacterized protein n=1 Tax=Meloidogyne enterolobii TaxID=390850 RepID=A0ACB0ZB82_MELEN
MQFPSNLVQVVPDTSNVAPPVKSEPAQFVFLHALDHSFNSESAHTCSLIASPIH